jgi:hypothetical protein
MIHVRCGVYEDSRRKRSNVAVNGKFTAVSNKLIELAGDTGCSDRKSLVIRIKDRI